jgi:UDP-N-acetylglucosamine 4-epimerase
MQAVDYSNIEKHLMSHSYRWLVTGCAGFIGTNISLRLLSLNQSVLGIDNFSNGLRENIPLIKNGDSNKNFSFLEGSISDPEFCDKITSEVDFVIQLAALGSVPRSIKTPLNTFEANINGFATLVTHAKNKKIKKFIYASSSSVFGDNADEIKKENSLGTPLSPYALSKKFNEDFGALVQKIYNFPTIGLRYFNVFGPHQNESNPYAAVIPIWTKALIKNEPVQIFGDGSTSRDFSFVENIIQANILSAFSGDNAAGKIFNIACGKKTSLNSLYSLIKGNVEKLSGKTTGAPPIHKERREGDILHSLADVSLASQLLGYKPSVFIEEGIKKTVEYFYTKLKSEIKK